MTEYWKSLPAMTFAKTPDFTRKTRKVYPYSMVINEVKETPINAVQVSENLNMRRSDAQRYLNKARNESYVSIYPAEHTEKLSSVFNPSKREVNNNKYYIGASNLK
jgi:hypothetical protein